MAAVTETLIELAKACLDAGAAGIYYGAQGGESHRFDEPTFVEYVKPWDLRFLHELKKETDLLVVHVCKDRIRLPLYADYPGDIFNWSVHESDYSLEAGHALLGRTVLGGIDTQAGVMIDGTDEAIRSEVTSVIGRFGRQSLLLGGDCTLPTDIPLGRIRTAVEVARVV
jgi:uroporphyrinogen decarboxylase